MTYLGSDDRDLIPLDYTTLLKTIIQVLESKSEKKYILASEKRLSIKLDDLIKEVIKKNPESPLESTGKISTINLSQESHVHFCEQIDQIRGIFLSHLQSRIKEKNYRTIQAYLEGFIQNLSEYQSSQVTSLGFSYNFETVYTLKQGRVTLEKTGDRKTVLKGQIVKITVRNLQNLDQQLETGLKKYIEEKFENESLEIQEDLEDVISNLVKRKDSDFYKLTEVITKDTLGKLQREAKVKYLEYLLEQTKENNPDRIYLQDLIRRLGQIHEYINDPDLVDGDYQVNYEGTTVDYKALFSRADAFDKLPIIPMITGYLGESRDPEEQQFIFGLKLKLNGIVQTSGKSSVFDHHLALLDPDSQEHKEALQKGDSGKEKILKILLLYFFVFASTCNPCLENYKIEDELNYDPLTKFKEKIVTVFLGTDEEKKKKLLRGIKEGFEKYQVRKKLEKLVGLLKKVLEYSSPFPLRSFDFHLAVTQDILEDEAQEITQKNSFFKSDVFSEKNKKYVQYLKVEKATQNTQAIIQLPVHISLEDIRYFSTSEEQQFKMGYDLKGISMLPLLFTPQNNLKTEKIYKVFFQSYRLIIFSYDGEFIRHEELSKSPQAFLYHFTFSLLSYILIKILVDSIEERIFIPLMRHHIGTSENPRLTEKFIANYSKILAHLLSETHLSNAQGMRINDVYAELDRYEKSHSSSDPNFHKFKISSSVHFRNQNALSSLYSVLPKIFKIQNTSHFPQLEKLAIIVISSRECDLKKTGNLSKISNLMGEIIGINNLGEGKIRLETLNTFSANYDHHRLYRHPQIILEQVNQLYEWGYQDFLYIAKAPHTSRLHTTTKEADEELYFMSKEILKSLRGDQRSIRIYPIFYDQYYVSNLAKIPQSLSIQDTIELSQLVPSKEVAVFFNLFNGIKVGKNSERFYNGVVSYATLLNIYQGILDDQEIRMGLINNRDSQGGINQLKRDILQYLTFFHFSRYEKETKQISLKLDPFENLIGEESIGALSVIPHVDQGKTLFNCLAFLTLVKEVLDRPGNHQEG